MSSVWSYSLWLQWKLFDSKTTIKLKLGLLCPITVPATHDRSVIVSSFELKLYNIWDSAERGPSWFHYVLSRYDRQRKWHLRNPPSALCFATTRSAHLMESVHFWFPYQWSWNVRVVIWTSPPDTADLIKDPGHILETPGGKTLTTFSFCDYNVFFCHMVAASTTWCDSMW